MRTVEIEGKVRWKAWLTASGTRAAECVELGLVLEADSLDELESMVREATHLLLIDLLEDNELDAFLRAKGWTATNIPAKFAGDLEFVLPAEIISEIGRGDKNSKRTAH